MTFPSEPTAQERKRKRTVVALVVVACLILAPFTLAGFFVKGSVRPGSFADDKRLAVAAVTRFHSQFNANDFAAIYKEATPTFQNSGQQAAVTTVMEKTKTKYGNVMHSNLVGDHEFPGGQVRFIYNTQCEKSATTELFVWQSDGEKASLVQYQIFSGTAKPEDTDAAPSSP